MAKKIIHVSQVNIKHNTKNRGCRPAIVIRDGSRKFLAHSVDIKGPSKIVYRPYNPLPCGARLWIETDAELDIS